MVISLICNNGHSAEGSGEVCGVNNKKSDNTAWLQLQLYGVIISAAGRANQPQIALRV